MTRKLLWLWLILGTMLMLAGIAHGQTRYEIIGPDGTRRVMDRASYLAAVERLRAQQQAQPRARTVGTTPIKLVTETAGVTYRRGPLGGQRVGVAAGTFCQVGPGGRMMCGPGGCGPSAGPTVPPLSADIMNGILGRTSPCGKCIKCLGGQQRAAPPRPWQPVRPTAPSTAQTPDPVVVPQQWRAVCRIRCDDGGGTYSWGSGTIIGVHPMENLAAVLTAWHVIQDQRGDIVVYVAGGYGYKAKVRAKAPEQDVALLWIIRPQDKVTPLALAATDPGPSDRLWAMGYHEAEQWGSYSAQFNKWYTGQRGQCWFEIEATPSGDGFSGGPIINAQCEVAGVRWGGAAGEKPMATPVSVIRHLFAESWLFQPPAPGVGLADIPIPDKPVVSTPLPPAPSAPGPPSTDPSSGPGACSGIAELRSEIAELRTAIGNLSLVPGVPGPPGPAGKDGKPGPAGPMGPLCPIPAVQPWYLKGLDPKTGKLVEIPIMPGDKVHLLEPMNVSQVTVEHTSK